MADFVESEAEESEDEIINRKRKVQDDDDDEEEEDDDEEKLREEMKDLINDDEEDEEDKEDSDEDIGHKRKKRHEDYDDGLEDEDYDLLEENLGVKVQRKKKFKRLRRIEDEESDDEAGDDSSQRVDDREAIANELFEGDDMEGGEDTTHVSTYDTQGDLEESEGESDESDFIVDDDGQPISKGKKKRHIKYNDAALQEAQEIFGVDFDYKDFEQEGDEYDEEDIDEDYEEEEEEEGGEVRPRRKKGSRKHGSKKSIFDVFEPIEIERSHLTDFDAEVRLTDLPERFQLRGVPVTEAEDDEIAEEAEWIYKQAFSINAISIQEGEHSGTGHQPIAGRKNPSAVGKIREALKFIRNQQFEVPFIAFYRKEYVEPDLNINDLWTVYKWDEKWCQLRTRKNNLAKLFEKMQQYQCDTIMADPDKPLSEGLRTLEHSDILRLKKAQTVEEVQDCYAHFMLYYGHDVPAMKEALKKKESKEKELEETQKEPDREAESTKIKHMPHRNTYAVCKEAGLDGLAKKFGLTADQFAENLRDNYQRHEVDQYPVEPKEVASDYVCTRFATAEDCLKAAKYMVATQLSREPAVRKCVRQTYYERAKVTVRPTKKGIKEVDENHPCFSYKYLKNKPVKDLRGEQFLKLSMAERDGFLNIDIAMDKQGGNDSRHGYLEEIKQLYERDEFSKNVQEWNVQRTEALEMALTNILYPTFQKELRLRLVNEAKEGVIKACCRKLYNWLKVAPYQVDPQIEEEDDFDTRDGVRVLSIAYSVEKDVPAFCAVIDGDGEVVEYLRLKDLLVRRNTWNESDRISKEKSLNSLKNLILQRKPHVVVVAAESREALMIIDDVKSVINDLIDSEGFPPIGVELMDNELGVLYMNSVKGENDFRDYPPLLRQAISLARRLQDPLMEFSQLCTPDEDILCLKYNSLQSEVNKDELLNALYLEFVNRTNEVGVDFNRAVQFSHTANLVQFICGLGPRKAASLIKILKASNRQLESRAMLVTFCRIGPKVFVNCAGFIKIDTASLVDSTETYIEVLDGSRVHPEVYEWARKMAVDALEYDDTSEDVNPAGALEEILENPEKLKDLDLDAFAEELERQGYGNKSITLYDIRAELNHKYKDLRTPYKPPNAEEVFNMLTKEVPETFYIGKLVLVTVTGIARRKARKDQLENANPIRNDETGLWQCPFCLKRDFPELSDVWSHFDSESCPGQAMGVRVRLDNGISGFIPTKMISDKHVTNPEERVRDRMILHARITKIDIERFAVDLTCKSSDLADKNNEWRPPKDLYYDYEAEEKDMKVADDTAKKQNRQVYLKRVICHPSFKNIGFKEAEKLLDSMNSGDTWIIRPSSKGTDHLTVTWKVADGINQHIDVREEGKENDFSLGRSLIIGGESFEDLDEIIARHVQPMSQFAQELLKFRYFISADGGKREEMERILYEEKKKAPNKIHYYISASKQFPGKFLLSYLPRNKVRHEFVTVTPEGLRYRKITFHSVNSLFRWFKEHFRDPIPGTPSMSVRTPMGQSSYIGNTPSINLATLDPQAIQRAAANLPSHVFSALSQVAGQTPAAFQGANTYGPGFSGGYNYQPYTPSQPVATPMAITPSYHAVPTPAHSQVPTPRYPQTPQQNWPHPAAQTPSRTTPKSTGVTTQDWKRMAEQWAKKTQETMVRGQVTPRTPIRGSPSPMVIESTPADATPLIDEF